MSGPQWRNVNASFNATWGNTMAVVAGRLTALSEDRNVLPTVVVEVTTASSTGRTGDGPRSDGGFMCRLRGRFWILGLFGGPRKDTIVLASTIGWLGRITRWLFGTVPSSKWSGCAWERKRESKPGARRVLTREPGTSYPSAVLQPPAQRYSQPGLTSFNATGSSVNL